MKNKKRYEALLTEVFRSQDARDYCNMKFLQFWYDADSDSVKMSTRVILSSDLDFVRKKFPDLEIKYFAVDHLRMQIVVELQLKENDNE